MRKRVCFFGDSITQNGEWIAEVLEKVCDRAILINCGVGGDTATNALARLDGDCLVHLPDTVVVMFGMNDVGYSLYEGDGNAEKKDQQIEKFKKSLRRVVETIRLRKATPILCTPTPYDDITYAKNTTNKGLARCAAFVRELTEEYGLVCVDFFAEMYPLMKKETLIAEDHIHPNLRGRHYMAQIFMKTLGITDTIDDSDFSPSKKNRARMETEHLYRLIKLAEWCFLYDVTTNSEMTAKQILECAEKRRAECNVEWIKNMYTVYIENACTQDRVLGTLICRTLEMCP